MKRFIRSSVIACAGATIVAIAALAAQPSVALAQSWKAPDRAAQRANPVSTTDAVSASGRVIFQRTCTMCHGARGKGDGPMASGLPVKPADLTTPQVQSQSDGALFWKILTGRGMMPSTQGNLTDEQRWTLVDYIRTLKAKNP